MGYILLLVLIFLAAPVSAQVYELRLGENGGCTAVAIGGESKEWLLTAKHCTDRSSAFQIRVGDQWIAAKFETSHPTADVALLSVPTDLDSVRVADRSPQVGEPVAMVGFSNGKRTWRGTIQRIHRDEMDIANAQHAIPGNSGGAVFNGAGEVVGIVSGYSGSQPCPRCGRYHGRYVDVPNAPTVVATHSAIRELLATAAVTDQPIPQIVGKPTLIIFSTKWCGPCRQAEAEGAYDALKAEWVVKITDDPALAQQYGVKAYPSFVVGGKVVATGYYGRERLLACLRKWLPPTPQIQPETPQVTPPTPQVPFDREVVRIIIREEIQAAIVNLPPGPEGPKGEKGDKGDKGDPGQPGEPYDPAEIEALKKRIVELENRQPEPVTIYLKDAETKKDLARPVTVPAGSSVTYPLERFLRGGDPK